VDTEDPSLLSLHGREEREEKEGEDASLKNSKSKRGKREKKEQPEELFLLLYFCFARRERKKGKKKNPLLLLATLLPKRKKREGVRGRVLDFFIWRCFRCLERKEGEGESRHDLPSAKRRRCGIKRKKGRRPFPSSGSAAQERPFHHFDQVALDNELVPLTLFEGKNDVCEKNHDSGDMEKERGEERKRLCEGRFFLLHLHLTGREEGREKGSSFSF